ncbi:hypothetical protein OGATHE_000054 [Ogataea polymorpha]|uniref:Uncharacterized protein n=1 Tax=Ogataea polymorpha TaxID=460523 RepID=A0A9P8THF4_9ASCO|nr:hypothetical protein OGATHE_000054 [Ogataea polymorpha]
MNANVPKSMMASIIRGEPKPDEAQSDRVGDLPAPEFVCADAEEQQADRRDNGCRKQKPEPELGLLDAAVAFGLPDHKPVREVARVQTSDQRSDNAWQIHQRNAGIGVVPRLVIVQIVLRGEVEREKSVLQPPQQPRQQHGREPEHTQHEHEPLQHARDDHGDPAHPPERSVLDNETRNQRPKIRPDRGSQDVDGQNTTELVRKIHVRQRELHLGLCAGLRCPNKQLRPDGVAGSFGQSKPHRSNEAEHYTDHVADFAAVKRRGRP